MSDLQYLLLVLGLLYLSECLYWVRRGSVVMRKWFLGGYGVVHPSPGLGAKRVGMVFLNPLPPFGSAFIVHQWPVSLTGEAAYGYVRQVINFQERPEFVGGYVRWDDMWKIGRDGEVIYVNKKIFARCNGEAEAAEVEAAMRRVQGAAAEGRGEVIAQGVKRMMNVRRVRGEMKRFGLMAGAWSGLRMNAHALFLLIFGAVPFTIGKVDYRIYLPMTLVLLAGMLILQGVTFFQAHKRIFPEAKGARWKATLTMVLTPTASVRACDALGKDWLAGYHPVAVAMVLCGETQRREFLRRTLLDLRHPMMPAYFSEGEGERAALDGFHEILEEAIVAVVKEGGYDPEELMGPPARQDETCKSYCPRCDGMYVVEEGVCEHCGGIGLKKFSEGGKVVMA